jgi:hypothetical protein
MKTAYQRIDIEWFEKIFWELRCGQLRRGCCVASHEHDGHMCQIVSPQLRHDIDTAQAGQMQIQEHECWACGLDREDRTFTVVGCAYKVTRLAQRADHKVYQDCVVVDDKDIVD